MKYLFFLLLVMLAFVSCKKDPEPTDDTQYVALKFDTLYASPDTFGIGGQTEIKAIASGTQLTYAWSVSLGDVLGSGATVNFVSSPCMYGTYQVSCTVSDSKSNQQQRICNITIQ
jgi:hypothetical protein